MARLLGVFILIISLSFHTYSQSVLSTGNWFKMEVSERGVYKLSYEYLKSAGINVDNINPKTFKVFGYAGGMLPQSNAIDRSNGLTEIRISVKGEEDMQFNPSDYILFYGEDGDKFEYQEGQLVYEHNLYSDENYYFITYGGDEGKRIELIENLAGDYPVISSFDDFRYFKKEAYNLLTSGRNWYTDRFSTTTEQTYNFNFANVSGNSEIKVTAKVMAQAFEQSSFDIILNNRNIGNIPVESIPDYTQNIFRYSVKGRESTESFSTSADIATDGKIEVNVNYQKNGSVSIGFLDFLLVEAKSELRLGNSLLSFRSLASLDNAISTFEIREVLASTQIWNVTNHNSAFLQETLTDNSNMTFSSNSDSLQEYIAFNVDLLSPPASISSLSNQNLKSYLDVEFLIITDPSFENEAIRLANFRIQNDNLNSRAVNIQKVYNEFSSGRQDITAIRDFAKYLYDNGQLRYLLLFGRGSYDYKNQLTNNTNFIPIYESRNSLDPLDTYASDDYFGFLEQNEGTWEEINGGNHTIDIGIGRLPVKSSEEAAGIVNKLIHYANNQETIGDWRNNIVFVADDGDFNLHQRQANELTKFMDTTYTAFQARKFFLDNFQQESRPSGEVSPKASEALDKTVDEGALIINFTGHGGESGWMQEQVLDVVQIQNWKNFDRLPLFVTATCEFGRHDDPRRISGGEMVVNNPNGGGIAIVSTCRPVSSASNFELNKAFYDNAYAQENNQYLRLGDIFMRTKNQSVDLARDANRVGNRNFALLGDPTTRLAYPSKAIEITQINDTSEKTDTLKALAKVKLSGQIKFADGNADPNFNGEVSFVIFDKEIFKTTLGNENSPYTYKSKENILFKGSSSVTNGKFDINFRVPKNISYEIGNGKINMYAYDNERKEDANGSDINLVVGGTSADILDDNVGPDIQLFIGDTLNTNLSGVSHNTSLVAILSDKNGINLSSFGVGNNITATLDGEQVFILNEYYTAFKNTYKRGYLNFPLSDLTKGKHSLTLKAWDTNNNSSESTINFTVADPNKVVIYKVDNYPNPFSETTQFRFTHNRAGDDLVAQLTISSPIGGVIFSREIEIKDSPSDVELTSWNGTSLQGQKLKAGIYLYSLNVRSIRDGAKNSAHQKLILFN